MLIYRSFVKQINVTEEKRNQKPAGSEVKTFSVPYSLDEIKENITIVNNDSSKSSKEQIINQAFKFHSQGNVNQPVIIYFEPEFTIFPLCAWVHSAGQIIVSPFWGFISKS